MHFVIQN